MVINEPNLFVGDVYDRMPVVLEQKDFDAGRKGRVEEATGLMKPAAENILKRWPVSRRVGKLLPQPFFNFLPYGYNGIKH
jgi:putative SOS response-associated peptidase YedK